MGQAQAGPAAEQKIREEEQQAGELLYLVDLPYIADSCGVPSKRQEWSSIAYRERNVYCGI